MKNSGKTTSFICDCMCHGAAVCLRAYGYYSHWQYGISDAEVVRMALEYGHIVVTGDSRMLERRIFTEGRLKYVFIPVGLGKWDQFRAVLDVLPLKRSTPRCMKCGGKLSSVDKESCMNEIPLRTAGWIDDYFRCEGCNSLFWKGTHWAEIEKKLSQYGKS